MWTLVFGHHEERTPMLGYEPTREDAMATSAVTSGVSERAWIGRVTARFRTIQVCPKDLRPLPEPMPDLRRRR
jgi:hypothetical protein